MNTKSILGLLTLTISFSGVSAMDMGTSGDSMIKDTMMDNKVMAPMSDAWMGAKGEHISLLQKYLVSKGFLTIPEGVSLGYFGPLTKKAVMLYQESLGVTPTGYFGPKTRMAMQDKVNMKETDTMMKDKMAEDGKMMKGDTPMKDTMSH